MSQIVSLCITIPVLAVLCWTDCKYRRLPNLYTLGLAVLGLIWRFAFGGLGGLVDGILGGLVCALFLLIPFLASFSQSTTPSLQSPPLTALTFTVSFLYYFFLSTDGIIYISLVLCLPSAFFNLNIRSLREEF